MLHRPVRDRVRLYSNFETHTHPAIKAPGFDSDLEEDGERTSDAMRSIDYLQQNFVFGVDTSRIMVTGLSMGGEITSWVGALDPRVAVVIPSGFSPDLNVMKYNNNHPCWQWMHANIREYVDHSDVLALVAPRPLIVQTGTRDDTFSSLIAPFASDKQVMRRARAAYPGAERANVIHHLHDADHVYRFDTVGVPVCDEPTAGCVDWQTSVATRALGSTVFDLARGFLGLP
jgi:hypothetical protein